jgi:3-dehydro-L-gulonate 2-dehydrogenase
VVLDMVAAMTALGNATHQLSHDILLETGISQMFVALNLRALGDVEQVDRIADEVVASLHACRPAKPDQPVRYPGEQTLRIRAENRRLGLPVDEALWAQIKPL